MGEFREGIWRKALWIILLVFFNVLIILGAAMMLKEFPQKGDRGICRIILRYDDYELFPKSKESASLENKFIKFAIENGIKMSIGITPFQSGTGEVSVSRESGENVQLLREGFRKDLFEICLHGYEHANNWVKWSYSEFTGVPLLTQKKWIETGKNKLESLTGAKIKVFIPPYNGWDQNTLLAIADSGFSILSAEARDFPKGQSIFYFPYTDIPKDFKYLLESNRVMRNKLLIINIHPPDLLEGNNRIGFSDLKELIKTIKDPNAKIELVSFKNAVDEGIFYTPEELLNFSKMLNWIRFWQNIPFANNIIKTKSLSANRPYYSNTILYSLSICMGIKLSIIGFLFFQIIGNKIRTRMFTYSFITLLVIAIFVMLWRSYEYLKVGQVIAGQRYSAIFIAFGSLAALFWQMQAGRKKK